MPSLNYGRVKAEAPGAYPFEDFEDCFGNYVAKVDPAGDPDLFKLGVAMARQGFVPHKGSTKTHGGYYEFEYAPDEVVWLDSGR